MGRKDIAWLGVAVITCSVYLWAWERNHIAAFPACRLSCVHTLKLNWTRYHSYLVLFPDEWLKTERGEGLNYSYQRFSFSGLSVGSCMNTRAFSQNIGEAFFTKLKLVTDNLPLPLQDCLLWDQFTGYCLWWCSSTFHLWPLPRQHVRMLFISLLHIPTSPQKQNCGFNCRVLSSCWHAENTVVMRG